MSSTKESRRKCSKCGKSPALDEIKLFRFPKPATRNLLRCTLWAKYLFPSEEQYTSLVFQKKLFSEHRMLCQDHFADEDFTDGSKNRLLYTAVPSDDMHKKKNKCCIPGCKSTSDIRKMYKFPCVKMIYQLWEQMLHTKYPSLILQQDSSGRCQQYCCILHFEPKYIRDDLSRKKYSIPTLFSQCEINSRNPDHPIVFSVLKEEENDPDTRSGPKLSSEEEHHIFCSSHDHVYGQMKKSILMIKQDFSKDEEVTSTETGLNTVHFPDDCRVNESLDEAVKHLYPNSTMSLISDIFQIKSITQEGVIDHNMYIPEVVDDISSAPDDISLGADADMMQIEPSEIIIDEKAFQKDIIHCFEQVSTTGLSEHDRKDLTDKHLVPGNCLLFGAPALNPEVKAALSRMEIERDQAIEHKQAILASAIANLVEAIGVVVSSEDNKAELLSLLVDTGRLLSDCQYHDTMTRRKSIINVFHKDIQEMLKNSKIDSYLFGKSISLQHNLTTAEATYKSGDLTTTPGSKTPEVMCNSGADATMAPTTKTADKMHIFDAEIIKAPSPETSEAIHNSDTEITMAPGPRTGDWVIQHSDEQITVACWRTTPEAIHNSGTKVTMTPEIKTAKVVQNSDRELTAEFGPTTAEAIRNSASHMVMAPSNSSTRIKVPRKRESPESINYVIEGEEKFKFKFLKRSPS